MTVITAVIGRVVRYSDRVSAPNKGRRTRHSANLPEPRRAPTRRRAAVGRPQVFCGSLADGGRRQNAERQLVAGSGTCPRNTCAPRKLAARAIAPAAATNSQPAFALITPMIRKAIAPLRAQVETGVAIRRTRRTRSLARTGRQGHRTLELRAPVDRVLAQLDGQEIGRAAG